MKRTITLSLLAILLLPLKSFSEQISNYLILEDIVPYKIERAYTTRTKGIDGAVWETTEGGPKFYNSAGIVGATGHFPEHIDTTYEVFYIGGGPNNLPSPTVQITQHPGSDSDKWLLHEVEDGYRDPDVLEAKWTQGARVREIEGNLIFGVRGSGYTWLTGSKVVNIEYTDFSGTKPEPLEVIKAYLVKFPSSITLTDADAKSTAHSTTWLKDEIDRRLWLADKWVAQITADDPKLYDKLDDVVKHLKVFLNYKEKYFGISEEEKAAGITAKSEQKALNIYLQQKDTDSIKKKLTAYKTWWTAHKGDAINL